MNLDVKNWGTFKVSDLFVVKYGVNLELNTCEETEDKDSSVNFVARTAENNGVSARVKSITGVVPQDKGLISVAGGGSVLSTFLQPEPFYSGRDLYTLESKVDISDEAKFFIITVIEQNKYKYSYGRQANKTLPDLLLKLPVNEQGKPDYKFMEQYVKRLHHKPLTTKNKSTKVPELNTATWKEFNVGKLFSIKRGDRIVHNEDYFDNKDEINIYPVITTTMSNNGVDGFYSEINCDGNCLISGGEASGMYTTYQPDPCWALDTVRIYTPMGFAMNKYLAFFLATELTYNMYRFSYGRKAKPSNMYSLDLKLPIQYSSDGSPTIDKTHQYSDEGYVPDWQFMEDYIKSLPYGDRI